jgi:hypothetical protein
MFSASFAYLVFSYYCCGISIVNQPSENDMAYAYSYMCFDYDFSQKLQLIHGYAIHSEIQVKSL